MSAPTQEILRFWCRAGTYRKGGCNRNQERARCSFYKWVCKHELYEPLKPVMATWRVALWANVPILSYHEDPRLYYIRSSHQYKRGYPAWEAPRCNARDRWAREFEKHRESAEANIAARADLERQQAQRRYEAAERRMTLRYARRSTFLQMITATHAIAAHARARHPEHCQN